MKAWGLEHNRLAVCSERPPLVRQAISPQTSPENEYLTSRNGIACVLSYSGMRTSACILAIALMGATWTAAAQDTVGRERRQRAGAAFHDGILLLHARSTLDLAVDGFRQDPYFYYFTGLADTAEAVLAIDGKLGESWLFLPSSPPFQKSGLQPEVEPGAEAAKRLGIEHVVDWAELEKFLVSRSAQPTPLYYPDDLSAFAELPANLLSAKSPEAPTWLQIVVQRWPAFEVKEAGRQIQALMEVQSADEVAALRAAARATVGALMAGMRAIRPNLSQRSVEAVVENTCWTEGARGAAFWPWAMSGDNAVFPHPFFSMARYDHLNRSMSPGELVRLDVGCESDHYTGDLGRTVPVSGHYDDAQRETWTIFVAAYHAGAKALAAGVTVDQVFAAWQKELVSHRRSAKSLLAQHAIDSWSDRKNLRYWQVHTTNLLAAAPAGPLRAGTTINFEPIAAVDGQGFFLEDMYLITKDGAELLTPGVPYSAEDIEAAMR
jgi:Xaa-Pro aminopeptidase